MRLIQIPFILLLASVLGAQLSASEHLIWPTPNRAFQEGRPITDYIQPTASGVTESGLFGCVRNGGSRFHEALDLFPIERDRKGEALDEVYSVLPGRVVHVSSVVGHSNYGRYVVVEHDQEVPAFHTLYAHLSRIAPGVSPGARVSAGSVLGQMGRSSSGSRIPRARAHLHFEIGFRLSDDFQSYYDRQQFGSPNYHGNWNGMNMVSIDPLPFYEAIRSGSVRDINEHLKKIPAVARIRVYTPQVPSFVRNYPALVMRPYEGQQLVAWDIAFTQYGVPKEWTPRFADEGLDGRRGDVKVLAYSPKLLEAQPCRRVLNLGGHTPSISSGTIDTLKKLFGFK